MSLSGSRLRPRALARAQSENGANIVNEETLLWMVSYVESRGVPGIPVGIGPLDRGRYKPLADAGLVVETEGRWRMTEAGFDRWTEHCERRALMVASR